MARQVLPIVGAVVGAYFGNPQLGYAIGSIIGNAVDPQVIEGPALGEGQVNTAREGGYRPIVLGTGCVGCNIINVGPEKIRTHRERQSKGGGPVSETKRRYRTFALRICEGPITGLLRIWQGEKLVYDVRPDSVITEESAKYAEGFTFYLGDEEQLPDPDLEAYMGAGNVNAYRGTAYIVFTNFDLTDTQGAIPNFRFEVSSSPPITPIVNALATYSSGFQRYSQLSPDGLSWGGMNAMGEPFGITYGAGSLHTFALWGSSSNVITSDTGLAPWVSATGVVGDNKARGWAGENGVVIVTQGPIGFSATNRSFDSGLTFSSIPTPKLSAVCQQSDGRWIGWIGQPQADRGFCYSLNDFSTTLGGAGVSFSFSQSACCDTDGEIAWFGTRQAGSVNLPTVLSTKDGIFIETVENPTLDSADSVIHIACGNGLVVCVGESGRVSFRDEDGWHGSTDDMLGFAVVGLVWNGSVFIVGGHDSDSNTNTIKTSEDGNNWTVRFTQVVNPGDQMDVLVALRVPPQIDAGPIPLSSIIAFIHNRCGHTAGQYDVSELTDSVDGVVFADSYTGSDAIRTIIPIYFADASEHDAGGGYKINYVKRGKPVVRTLVLDDLVDEPEEAVRQDSLERAAKFHLHFQNPTIGYAAAKATSSRSSPDVTSNVTGEVSVQVPITFADVNEAAQRSNILHKVSWVEVAGTQEIMISDADMDLVPTDVIGLSLRGILTRYRMVTQQYVDGTLKCEFMADRQSAYTSNVTGIPLPEPEPPPPSIVGPTVSVFGDWPALVDGHDALISYAAATGTTPAWWGATYQRSLDAGANYTTAAMFDDFNTIMGTVQDPITDASEHFTDTTNVLRISLYTDDQIESLSQSQFLSEGGGFALSWMDGDERRWEMLQYRDAEQDSDGVWNLSTLLRGRLNTETAAHAPGDIFVLLDNSLKVMPMQSAWLGMDLTHRAYSHGETPETAVPYTDEFTGKSQTEWPVANLLLERSGDDIEAVAVPRHRFGTNDAPVQSVNHSGYRWTATDGVSSIAVDSIEPTQTFDVTGWSTPVTVTVAQLNRFTGAGPSVSEEIV